MTLQRATRSIDATPFKFEKAGDRIDGYYIKTDLIAIDGREVKKHVFATAKGLVSVLGQADMAQQLRDNDLTGRRVVVTFSGKVQKLKGGKTMKLYEVDFDRGDVYKGAADSEPELAEGTEAYEEEYAEEEEVLDEVPRTAARKPAHAAAAPDAAAQARVQTLLGRNRTK